MANETYKITRVVSNKARRALAAGVITGREAGELALLSWLFAYKEYGRDNVLFNFRTARKVV